MIVASRKTKLVQHIEGKKTTGQAMGRGHSGKTKKKEVEK